MFWDVLGKKRVKTSIKYTKSDGKKVQYHGHSKISSMSKSQTIPIDVGKVL